MTPAGPFSLQLAMTISFNIIYPLFFHNRCAIYCIPNVQSLLGKIISCVCIRAAAGHCFFLVPVLAICGRFQAAEDYSSKAVEYLGPGGGGVSKIVPPLVAALCGRTTVAQGLVQQFLASSDLQQQNDQYHRTLLV